MAVVSKGKLLSYLNPVAPDETGQEYGTANRVIPLKHAAP